MRGACVGLATMCACSAAAQGPTATKEVAPNKPVIGLSVNHSAESQMVRGWPALVRVRIFHPQRSLKERRPAFVISSMTGAWTDAVTLKVTSAGGNVVSWKFELVGEAPNPSVQIGASDSAIAEWKLPAEQTRTIAAGQYFVQAVLAAPDGSRWNGAAASPKALVRVVEAPPKLNESQQYMKALLAVDTSGENDEGAVAAASAFSKAFPKNLAGVTLWAGLLERKGQYREARDLVSKALEAYFKLEAKPKEPPVPLLILYQRLNHETLPVAKSTSTMKSTDHGGPP